MKLYSRVASYDDAGGTRGLRFKKDKDIKKSNSWENATPCLHSSTQILIRIQISNSTSAKNSKFGVLRNGDNT